MNGRPGAAPGTWHTLRAAAPVAVRGATTVAALLAGCGAVFARWAIPDPEVATQVAVGVAAVAVFSLWVGWIPRLLLLWVDGVEARIPGLAGAVLRALATTALATVVLPAGLLVLAGAEPALAFPALVTVAAAALLVAMLPAWAWLAGCFLPLAVMLLHVIVARLPVEFDPEAGAGWLLEPGPLSTLALSLVMLAGWRWRAIVRGPAREARGDWRMPAVLAHRAGAWGGDWILKSAGQLPDWFWPAGQTAGGGPHDPVRAIRILLGTPFAPLSRWQWVSQLGIGVLVFLAVGLYLYPAGLDGTLADQASGFMKGVVQGGLAGGVLGGAGVLIGMFGTRLDRMTRAPSGEMSELALLPRLGPPGIVTHLLRAVSGLPAASLLAGTALLLALMAATGTDAAGLAWSAVACAGIGLLTAQVCLRPLAGLPMLRWWGYLQAGITLLLVMATIVLAVDGRVSGPTVAGVLSVSWLAMLVASGLQVVHALRRIKARPHPFVRD